MVLPSADSSRWIVLGCGIRHESDATLQMDGSDWHPLLSSSAPDPSQVDGHYLALSWSEDEVRCFTDRLGLRRLYATQTREGMLFSTHLGWIARFTGGVTFDAAAFGGHWLTFNQFSYRSFGSGVERTGPDSTMVITPGRITVRNNLFTPLQHHVDRLSFIRLVERHLSFRPRGHERMVFGLSGGLDSRFLFGVLQDLHLPFSLYALGHPAEPDCEISGRIASQFGLERHTLYEGIGPMEDCIARMRAHVARSLAIAPASAYQKLGGFSRLQESGVFVVDGGMGEIVRRQYLNRIRMRGTARLRREGAGQLIDYLRVPNPPIFNRETAAVMRRAAIDDLRAVLETMPPVGDRGIHDFLDLMAVRYRFPNYAGIEQSRMDEILLSFSPFCQHSVVEASFGLPPRLKKNGALFREVIRSTVPRLRRHELVKDGVRYPFFLTTPASWVLMALKRFLGWSFRDPIPAMVLATIKPYVLDLAHSSAVRTCPYYDYQLIRSMVERYYAGDTTGEGFVDRWLAFELFRQVLASGMD